MANRIKPGSIPPNKLPPKVKAERVRANKIQWRDKNRERVKQYYRDYRKAHGERMKILNMPSKMRRRAPGWISRENVENVISRHVIEGRLICYLCQADCSAAWHMDHKLAICHGGTNAEENLGIACPRCNYKKHTKTEQEYLSILKDQTSQ